jgi:hypothetical protein
MINLSLARIMYGTNEDLHASNSVNVAAVSSLARTSGENAIARAGAASTLGNLLHKAWAALHHKD